MSAPWRSPSLSAWVALGIMAIIAALLVSMMMGCSTGGGGKPTTMPPAEQHIRSVRESEIRRQAPLLGIPVEQAITRRARAVYLCESTEKNGDGSYSCDSSCTRLNQGSCVHAWCSTAQGLSWSDYLFVLPDLRDGCIAHEVHHELIVGFYGLGGHPARSVVSRIDNGNRLVISHRDVIGWRWPALVNWALPKAFEVPGWDGIKCVAPDEIFEDGGGI